MSLAKEFKEILLDSFSVLKIYNYQVKSMFKTVPSLFEE